MTRILCLLVLILVLPSVFSAVGVHCVSDDASMVMVNSAGFKADGTFSVVLTNLGAGDIELQHVVSDSDLEITPIESQSFTQGATIDITGSYPIDRGLNDTISLLYADSEGNLKSTFITCSGATPGTPAAQSASDYYFMAGVVLVLAGLASIYHGYKKNKRFFLGLGILMICLGTPFIIFPLVFVTSA